MIQNVTFTPYRNSYNPSFSSKKSTEEKPHSHSCSRDFLLGTLFALSCLGIHSCQFNDPNYNQIDRKAVYDPCCGTTQTQFKDLWSPLEKLDLMLNNLGIIDSDEISWNDIDSIKINGDDGSEFLLENRGVKLNGGQLNFALTRITSDNKKDSVICHMNNGYGGIDVTVEATNNKLIGEIPVGYSYIWQGNKGEHDDRFVIVNTAPEGLWDNVIMMEKAKGNKIEVLGKDGEKVNLLLDTVEIYEK